MKNATTFRALRNRRLADSRARLQFMVRSLNKDGSVSRMTLTETDWQFNAFETEDEARVRIVELERLNPGRRFTITPAR